MLKMYKEQGFGEGQPVQADLDRYFVGMSKAFLLINTECSGPICTIKHT